MRPTLGTISFPYTAIALVIALADERRLIATLDAPDTRYFVAAPDGTAQEVYTPRGKAKAEQRYIDGIEPATVGLPAPIAFAETDVEQPLINLAKQKSAVMRAAWIGSEERPFEAVLQPVVSWNAAYTKTSDDAEADLEGSGDEADEDED